MKTAREKRCVLATGVGLMAIGLVMAGQAAEALRATPPLRDPAMPDAPRQGQQWTPPESALPQFFVRATTALFEQGMADPRECEYRSVQLVGESSLYKNPAAPRPVTHAWVLPERARDGPRFAVAWNGLIYPLTALGDAANLEADVRALVAAADAARAKQPAGARSVSGWFFAPIPLGDHVQTASQEGLTPAKVSLLLRLGRASPAESLWVAGTGRKPQRGSRNLTPYGVSYLTMASDWAWALFDRAVDAHARADHPLALASARDLARIRPLIEAKAEAMGFPRRQGVPQDGAVTPYLDFLGARRPPDPLVQV